VPLAPRSRPQWGLCRAAAPAMLHRRPSRSVAWQNGGFNGGLMWFNQQNGGFNGIYPLVMTNIAI